MKNKEVKFNFKPLQKAYEEAENMRGQMALMNAVSDISIEEYHACAAVSRSGLHEFKTKSPLHYWYKYLSGSYRNARPDIITKRTALDFGNALHTYILEPHKFDEEYIVWDGMSRVSKAGKEQWAALQAEHRAVIDIEAVQIIKEMQESLSKNTEAFELISGGLNEKSIFWKDEDSGMDCKVRPDVWQNEFIVDLKTAASADFNSFQRATLNNGYYLQAAMIKEALYQVCNVKMENFIYIVIEKEPPYAIGIYKLDEAAIKQGHDEFKETLMMMAECKRQNNWPSYETAIVTLPRWASRQEGEPV